MKISHHPSTHTIMSFACGAMGGGGRLVVAAHFEVCPACRLSLEQYETVGAVILSEAQSEPAPLGDIEEIFARFDAGHERVGEVAVSGHPRAFSSLMNGLPDGIMFPASLASRDFGGWRWMAPGISCAKSRAVAGVDGAEGEPELRLLRVGPGKRLFRHGHTGTEWTAILAGAYLDEGQVFGAGDFSECDSETDHQPIVVGDAECICLIAMEGNMKPDGLLGRLYQTIFNP